MNIKQAQTLSRWVRLREVLVTTAVGGLPTVMLGVVLRRLLYRTIFKQLGTAVFIQHGAEFITASHIEIGDEVHIFRGVRIDGRGQNNRICIRSQVALERGVDIGALENSSIEIGERTFISSYTCIAGPGDVKIGKDCLIAAHSGIFANNHTFVDSMQRIRDQGVTAKGIVIGDDCWLGHGVTVVDGVTIGQGSVIGAGAVVTKDISPYSVALGVPARVVANRKPNQQVNSTRQATNKESNCLPIALHAPLVEIEKTAELIHQLLQTNNDNAPAHLVLENLFHQLFDCIRQVMAVDTITVLLRAEGGHQLAVRATLGLEEEIIEEVRIPIGRGFAGSIAASCKPLIVDDLSAIEVSSPILRDKGIQSMIGVPLLGADQVIGVFHVGTVHPRQFTQDDVQLLQLIADRLGSSLNQMATVLPL